MKKTVNWALSSLSEKDTISVIRFGEKASIVGHPGASPPYLWYPATEDRIERIINDVNAIEVSGRSNLLNGFDFAFDLIDNSLKSILANSKSDKCKVENIAFLFFSDGKMNLPSEVDSQKLIDFASSRVDQIEAAGSTHMHTFLYSISNPDVNQVAKQMSCAIHGFWKPVTSSMTPANVTLGYQTLFSTPLGIEHLYNFTAWSDPYIFTSSGESGYTVSALVYYREVEPPRFMGAVGMDVGAEAARQLYGGTLEETELNIKAITRNISLTEYNTTCEEARINLTYCEIQSIRHLSGGNEAICYPSENSALRVDLPANSTVESNATDEVIFNVFLNCSKAFVQPCPGLDEYPDNLWKNVGLQDLPYEDRVCCEVGTNSVSKKCPKLDEIRDTKISDAAIFGIMFGALAIAEIIGCYFCFGRKRKNKDDDMLE